MNVRKLLSLLLSLSMALALLPAGAVTARAEVSIPVICSVAQGKGSVETNESSVSPGGTFTMTIIPESGYKLENIFLQECVSDNDDGTMNNTSLTESNIQVEQSTPNSNQYTFTIPENYSISTQSGYFYLRVVAYFVSEAGTESGGNGSSNAENGGGTVDPEIGPVNPDNPDNPVTTSKVKIFCLIDGGNGSVSLDKSEASPGESVTLTVTPDQGYELDNLAVMQGDTPVDVSKDDDENYHFTMPAGPVTVTATFKNYQPVFDSRTLVLAGQIGMNYYVKPPENFDGNDTYLTFTLDGKTYTQNWSEGEVQTDGRVRFTCPVNSIQMADPITAQIHSGDWTMEDTYTVEQYLDYLVENAETVPEYEKALKLVKAIHDYGYYAQLALDSEKKHTAMHAPYKAANELFTPLSGYPVTATLANGVTDPTYSLSLDSETAINFYFTTEETVTEDKVTVTSGGNPAAFRLEQAGTNRYRVVIPNISAHLLGNTYTATVTTANGDSVFTGSALSYAQTVLSSDSTSDALKHAVAALYNYYQETVKYRNGTT